VVNLLEDHATLTVVPEVVIANNLNPEKINKCRLHQKLYFDSGAFLG
jgi:hypothetical protein